MPQSQRKRPPPDLKDSRTSQSNMEDVSFKAKERNLFERRSGVTGTLLISSQINSQLFPGNKDIQGGNQPPKGQMVSVQSPLTPPALALSDRAVCALGETGHPANSQSTLLVQSMYSRDTVPVWRKLCFFLVHFHRMFSCRRQPLMSKMTNLQLMATIRLLYISNHGYKYLKAQKCEFLLPAYKLFENKNAALTWKVAVQYLTLQLQYHQ